MEFNIFKKIGKQGTTILIVILVFGFSFVSENPLYAIVLGLIIMSILFIHKKYGILKQ